MQSPVPTAPKQLSPSHVPISDFALLPGTYFYKKVFGTFCQGARIFEIPGKQCSAMAVAAMAYNSIRSVHEWNCEHIDALLLAGDECYQLNLYNIQTFSACTDTWRCYH